MSKPGVTTLLAPCPNGECDGSGRIVDAITPAEHWYPIGNGLEVSDSDLTWLLPDDLRNLAAMFTAAADKCDEIEKAVGDDTPITTRTFCWNGLWRRGAGTRQDPDNGRLILRITGISVWLYTRKFENLAARFRARYWIYVRRYKNELCRHCGRPVRLVYHAPDWIWEAVTGNARSPEGEAAAGVLCPRCLDDLAEEKGLPYLRWTCAITDEVMYG